MRRIAFLLVVVATLAGVVVSRGIQVQACGVCRGDLVTKDGSSPGIHCPRVPGHEVAGIIVELGDGVSE
jgi:D-arabinose 1-dehydrogenase-like Zn-dependent alcohol dehydrogenase